MALLQCIPEVFQDCCIEASAQGSGSGLFESEEENACQGVTSGGPAVGQELSYDSPLILGMSLRWPILRALRELIQGSKAKAFIYLLANLGPNFVNKAMFYDKDANFRFIYLLCKYMWLFIINLTLNSVKERNSESDTIYVHPEQLVSLKLEAENQVGFKVFS